MQDYQITGIVTPHDNDVLSGRGNSVNSHPGNKRFRDYVYAQREHYAATPKIRKPVFAKLIVNTIRNLVPPGRFLIQDKETKLWSDIGDKKAWDKTRQALREKIPSTTVPKAPPSGSIATAALSSSSTVQLREMLVHQLSAKAALNQSADTWLSENAGVDSIESGNSASVTSSEESASNESVVKAFPPKQSITNGNRKSSLKRFPRYPENVQYDSIGTFSSTGLSLMTDRTNRTSVSNMTGVSFATGSSTETASCSSELVPKVKNESRYNDVDMHENSLFLEGILAGKDMAELKNAFFADLDSSELLPEVMSDPSNTTSFNNSLFLEEMVAEEISGSALSKIKTSEPSNTNNYGNIPLLNRTVQQKLGEKEMSGLTDAKSVPASERDQEDRLNSDYAETTLSSNIPRTSKDLDGRQISGLNARRSEEARSHLNAPSSLMADLSDIGLSDMGHFSSALNAMETDDLDSRASSTVMSDGLSRASNSLMSIGQNSLLRASLSTFAPDIGEGNENKSTSKDNCDESKHLSYGTLKSDDMMSLRSRRRSSTNRRYSGLSNLDDLSYFSGRVSVCENMSAAESGIFSMTDKELVEWEQEAIEWEEEAEREDIQFMQEELLQIEENNEEVNNLNEMSSMMSDTMLC